MTISLADASARSRLRATLRTHRTEIVIALALIGAVSIGAVVAWSHLLAAAPTDACWLETTDEIRDSRSCRRAIDAFRQVQLYEAQTVVQASAFLPFAVGLLLAVPITARAGSRGDSRDHALGLVGPTLVMLGVVVLGLSLAAALVANLTAAPSPERSLHAYRALEALTVEPLPFVARGIMAFGIGLLSGALLRRSIAAYAVAGLILLGVIGLGAPVVHGIVAERVAAWTPMICVPADPEERARARAREPDGPWGCDFPQSLVYFATSFRDVEGRILTQAEAQRVMRERCPTCTDLADEIGDEEHEVMHLIAPAASYRTFEAAEAVTWTLIGVVAIVLTFPVLAWRRRRRNGATYPRAAATPASG